MAVNKAAEEKPAYGPAEENVEYTEADLKKVWDEFAETRKAYQAEYHLLTQPYRKEAHVITVLLHNPVEETLLNTFRSDLTTYLRERLKNSSIQVTGELQAADSKKTMYTNREKLEHLMEKNPFLKELKDRLGLDTDY